MGRSDYKYNLIDNTAVGILPLYIVLLEAMKIKTTTSLFKGHQQRITLSYGPV